MAASRGLLILVPARRGSKGLPGKNVKPLGGVPLLGWTARSIRAARIGGRAVLSTDDPAIAEVGVAEGLDVPFLRPTALAADDTDMVDVVIHAVEWMEQRAGFAVGAIMLLQPTCPFRNPRRLVEGLALLSRPETDGVIGVARLERSPSLLYREEPDGFLQPLAPWEAATLRQRVRPTFTPNGTFYLVTREALDRHRRLFPPRLRPLETTTLEGIDIDTPDDWAIAEAIVAAGLAAP
ncbi:MAG: acylneuraminate cytidylyltransferase family protein [Candidatus Rokubacteria bacterium]|nr:acylneuraminate cytidylyltransferase family protein [Candidatus Rokubacteria bacterium]